LYFLVVLKNVISNSVYVAFIFIIAVRNELEMTC